MKYRFPLPSGQLAPAWKESRLLIEQDDEVIIYGGWAFGDRDLEIEVTDRQMGFSRRNLYIEKPHFYGGYGVKAIDCHMATIIDAEFEDLRGEADRNSTAIRLISRNKANGYRIVRPLITGYERAGLFLGNMEGGRIDFPIAIGCWRGFVHKMRWNNLPIYPGPEYMGGHINVAMEAIIAPEARQSTVFRTNVHRNLADPIRMPETVDNFIQPIISPGGDGEMEIDANWPQRWKDTRRERQRAGSGAGVGVQ